MCGRGVWGRDACVRMRVHKLGARCVRVRNVPKGPIGDTRHHHERHHEVGEGVRVLPLPLRLAQRLQLLEVLGLHIECMLVETGDVGHAVKLRCWSEQA